MEVRRAGALPLAVLAATVAPLGLAAHEVDGAGPAPLTVGTALTTWSPEPLPIVAVLAVGVLYLVGVRRLRRRGDHWPPGRTVAFVGLGLGTLLLATTSFLAVYDTTLLSVHMVQHMMLSMVAPVFLALGAPITLALRTLPARPRRALLGIVHSRPVGVITFPLVAMALFIVNPWALYFSPLYEATLRNPWLHDVNHLHFVLVGSLWFWTILGIDPLPNRPSYPMRMLAVFLSLPFHAFLGVTIMGTTTLIAADWYTALDRTWGPSPLADQQLAGGILWVTGDLLSILLFSVLAVQWSRASDREARAVDRRLDREEAAALGRSARPAAVPSAPVPPA